MLELDLTEQIKKHLPAQVGETLQGRLKLADDAEKLQQALLEEEQMVSGLKLRLDKANASKYDLEVKVVELTKELQEYQDREVKLRIDEHVLQTKLELTAKHRAENLEIVRAVFQNNRLKYREHGTMPVAVEGVQPSQYNSCGSPGHVHSSSFDKTVEQES
jgi:hypothetical protein